MKKKTHNSIIKRQPVFQRNLLTIAITTAITSVISSGYAPIAMGSTIHGDGYENQNVVINSDGQVTEGITGNPSTTAKMIVIAGQNTEHKGIEIKDNTITVNGMKTIDRRLFGSYDKRALGNTQKNNSVIIHGAATGTSIGEMVLGATGNNSRNIVVENHVEMDNIKKILQAEGAWFVKLNGGSANFGKAKNNTLSIKGHADGLEIAAEKGPAKEQYSLSGGRGVTETIENELTISNIKTIGEEGNWRKKLYIYGGESEGFVDMTQSVTSKNRATLSGHDDGFRLYLARISGGAGYGKVEENQLNIEKVSLINGTNVLGGNLLFDESFKKLEERGIANKNEVSIVGKDGFAIQRASIFGAGGSIVKASGNKVNIENVSSISHGAHIAALTTDLGFPMPKDSTFTKNEVDIKGNNLQMQGVIIVGAEAQGVLSGNRVTIEGVASTAMEEITPPPSGEWEAHPVDPGAGGVVIAVPGGEGGALPFDPEAGGGSPMPKLSKEDFAIMRQSSSFNGATGLQKVSENSVEITGVEDGADLQSIDRKSTV